MFKELRIQKSKKTLATLLLGQVYTNHEYVLLYIGLSPSRMSAEFKIINTDPIGELKAMGNYTKPNMEFIGSLSRILLC